MLIDYYFKMVYNPRYRLIIKNINHGQRLYTNIKIRNNFFFFQDGQEKQDKVLLPW